MKKSGCCAVSRDPVRCRGAFKGWTKPIVNEPPDHFSPILWRVCPARRRPWLAAAVCGVIGVLAVAAAMAGGHPAWGIGFACVLLLTQSRFFLPTTFVLSAQSLEVRHAGHRRIIEKKAVVGGDQGISRAILRIRVRGRSERVIVLYADGVPGVRGEAADEKGEICEMREAIGGWIRDAHAAGHASQAGASDSRRRDTRRTRTREVAA